MTVFVFALVTTMGSKTISTEYFSGIDACLYYQKRINTQHIYHHPKEQHLHAQCRPTRVDPNKVEVFDH